MTLLTRVLTDPRVQAVAIAVGRALLTAAEEALMRRVRRLKGKK